MYLVHHNLVDYKLWGTIIMVYWIKNQFIAVLLEFKAYNYCIILINTCYHILIALLIYYTKNNYYIYYIIHKTVYYCIIYRRFKH